ncbi:SET domain-containing protein-lysine N-methyltransferase [Patescibacteria group bacterium]|nr:SET domain-containing protein-lysine N-methyltransferase [Patescibacteria group bacterium]
MYTTVRDSPIHGRGVFATKAIPRGARIFEYTGELITREEENLRELENDKTGVTYIYQLSDHESIDGAYGGNDSRFVNHSCDPNVEGVIEGKHIYYVAIRDIRPGEELFIDYAFDKDSKREPCHCGAAHCRGVMNAV